VPLGSGVGFRALGTMGDAMNGSEQKNVGIECWRGLSIILVMYYHFSNRIPHEIMGSATRPTIEFYSGKLGVYIFFIISGYLISQTISQSRDLAQFYAKRLSRLWPLFILACVTIFVWEHVLPTPVVPTGVKDFDVHGRTFVDLVGSMLFLEDLGIQWVDGVFWSILVELKYYFFVGIACYAFGEKFVTKFAWIAIGLSLLDFSLLAVAHSAHYTILNKLLHGILIAQYMPFFAVGMLFFEKKFGLPLILASVLCCLQVGMAIGVNEDLNMPGTIRFGVVLSALIIVDVALKGRILFFFGRYSYSIYLFHQVIGLSVIMMLTPKIGIDLAIAAALGFVIALAVAGSAMVEWRFRRNVSFMLYRLMSVIGLDRLLFRAAASGGAEPLAQKSS
jgi:peptidoglycan/LPS O-acetylase OafA/YrhL